LEKSCKNLAKTLFSCKTKNDKPKQKHEDKKTKQKQKQQNKNFETGLKILEVLKPAQLANRLVNVNHPI